MKKRNDLVNDLDLLVKNSAKIEAELVKTVEKIKSVQSMVNEEMLETGGASTKMVELAALKNKQVALEEAVQFAGKKVRDAQILIETFDHEEIVKKVRALDAQLIQALSDLYDDIGLKGLKGKLDRINDLVFQIRGLGIMDHDAEVHSDKASFLWVRMTEVLLLSWKTLEQYNWIPKKYPLDFGAEPGPIPGFGRRPS